MQTVIKIVRDRDQTVLEQDVAEVSDGRSVGNAIADLLTRIRAAHPHAELHNLTIKVGDGAEALA